MKEVMMAIGKMNEQEALMDMLDRDDWREDDFRDFNRDYWKNYATDRTGYWS